MSITLEITNSQITMSTENGNGGKQIKIIDPDDFASAMAKQCRVETGLLPANTRFFTTNGQLTSILLEVKAHSRKVNMLNEMLDIPFPSCLMYITTINQPGGAKHISASYFHCYNDIMLSRDTKLLRFPYGNIFANGGICWGSVRLPQITELYQLGTLPEIFFNSQFNGHIDSGIFRPFTKKVPGPNGTEVDLAINRGCQLARHLHDEKATEFPMSVLTEFGQTLGDFLRGANKNG